MDALTLLRLQMEWGADEALEAEPLNRLKPAPPAPVLSPNGPGHKPAGFSSEPGG